MHNSTQSASISPVSPSDKTPIDAEPRTWRGVLGWLSVGVGGAMLGTRVAAYYTAQSIGPNPGPYDGLGYLLTLPAGYFVGAVLAGVLARYVDRASLVAGDQFSRLDLAICGAIVPFAVFATGMYLAFRVA